MPKTPEPNNGDTKSDQVDAAVAHNADGDNPATPKVALKREQHFSSPSKDSPSPRKAQKTNAVQGSGKEDIQTTVKDEDDILSVKEEPIEYGLKKEEEGIKKEGEEEGRVESELKNEYHTSPNLPLFHAVTILFVPLSKTNKHRAELCVRHGGKVATEYSDKVTHIIVSTDVTVPQLMHTIKLDTLPKHVAVIYENWFADCIEADRLVGFGGKEVLGIPRDGEAPLTEKRSAESPGEEDTEHKRRRRPSEGPSRSTTPPASPKSKSVLRSDMSKEVIEARGQSMLEALQDVRMAEHAQAFASDAEDDDDELEEEEPHKHKKKQPQKQGAWVDNFLCIRGPERDPVENNPNWRTIEILGYLLKYYEAKHDEWRAQSYRKAISVLKRQTKKITTKKEAVKLPGIGESIGSKIEEIVDTNGLKILDQTKLDTQLKVTTLFEGIWGVGKTTARNWYQKGFRSLKDIAEKATLTANQKVGLEHYNDFHERIPRDEVTRHFLIVQQAANELDPDIEAHIMGSYRRGAASSGDIDMIFTKKDATLDELQPFLKRLVKKLTDDGFLTCQLTGANTKWYGCSKLADIPQWRRIDFLLVPWTEKGAAFIYFTGNDLFNRSIRLLANKKGYSLNQHGLYGGILRSEKGNVKLNDGYLIEGESEHKIFEILGVPYWEPWERDV